jgi:hypothetical protein
MRSARLVSTRISERGSNVPALTPSRSTPQTRPCLVERDPDLAGWEAPKARLLPRREPPRQFLPKHVRLCRSNQGAIYWWNKETPDRIYRRPYRCCSWRCVGPCARREAAVTFARIQEAMGAESFDHEGWVFLVLTLDRDGHYSGEAWPDVQTAFRTLSKMSRNFMARVRRLCERNGWRSPGSDWVATVEQHKSGWPHVNLVMYAPEMARALAAERARYLLHNGWASATKNGKKRLERQAALVDGDLWAAAVSTGWGVQSTAEQARSRDALAGYMVKIAGKLDQVAGEVAKKTQSPSNAEGKFRRLRSGKGFLPERRKRGGVDGTMVRRELDPQRSAFGAVPLHEVKDPERAKRAAMCAAIEEDRMRREALAQQAAVATGLPYAQIAPPVIESYRIVGENFEVQGAAVTIEGERGYAVDADGFVKWSEPRDVDQTVEGAL